MKRSSSATAVPAAPVLAILGVSVLAAISGCRTSCDDKVSREPVRVTTGLSDAAAGVYESTPWNGRFHDFEPDRRYDFVHGLNGTPRLVQTFVAFADTPLGEDDTGNVSESAGNEAIIESVNSEFIRVRNDTCETFFLRVAASGPIDEAGAGGAGD